MNLGLYGDERFAMFVDGANLFSAAKALGFDIDYKKLLKLFRDQAHLIRAYYYTALFEDQEYSPIRPLVDWLDYNGYTMVTKPAKQFMDSQGRQRVKGNMDMELAIDMLEMAKHLDHVVLFSGDGDFRILCDAVQKKGIRVSVVSTIKTSPPMIADELRRQADVFIELNDLKSVIARSYHDSHRNEPQAPAPQRTIRGPAEDFDGDIGTFDDDDEDIDDNVGNRSVGN